MGEFGEPTLDLFFAGQLKPASWDEAMDLVVRATKEDPRLFAGRERTSHPPCAEREFRPTSAVAIDRVDVRVGSKLPFAYPRRTSAYRLYQD